MERAHFRSRLMLWLAALVATTLLVFFAYNMYPVPDGDSIFFLPAIKSFAANRVLENKIVDLSFKTDPAGLGRFLFYTPGFPLALGSAMSFLGLTGYQGILVILSLIRAASTLLFAKAIILLLERANRLSNAFYLITAIGLIISNGLFLFASNGRPEILTIFVVSLALLGSLLARNLLSKHLFLSACVAILFPVSIASGVIGLSIYLLYILFDIDKPYQRIIIFTMVPIAGASLLGLAYLVAGLPVEDGLKGLAIHSRLAVSRNDTSLGLIISYWKTWSVFGLIALTGLVRDICLLPRSKGSNYTVFDKAWACIALSILMFSIYFFGLRAAPIHYNLYAFLPLYQFFAFRFALDYTLRGSRLFKFILGGAIGIGLLALMAEPLRTVILYPYYSSSGSTYVEARNIFSSSRFGECSLMYTDGLAVLDERQEGSQFSSKNTTEDFISERIKADPSTEACIQAFVQEINSNSATPYGMEKVVDFSDSSRWTSRLRSLRLLNSPKGYSFNAYIKRFNNQ